MRGKKVNYISHHSVNKPDKATTKRRLVSNSSLPNSGKGPSVNQLWPKGPNPLKPLQGIMIRFRCYPVAMVFDVYKAFHGIHTTENELFLRLMLWRHGNDVPMKTYGYLKVAF